MVIRYFFLFVCSFTFLSDFGNTCSVETDGYAPRHILINNLEGTNLTESFVPKINCSFEIFKNDLNELQTSFQNYIENSKINQTTTVEEKKRKNKSKDKDIDNSYAQIGFILYSLNTTKKTNRFIHQSFNLIKTPSNQTLKDQEVVDLSNDVLVLKALIEDAKHKLKIKQKMLSLANIDEKSSKKNKNSKKHNKND